MAEERVMIFIDGSNLFHSSKDYKIDFDKMRKKLAGGRNLIRTYYYAAEAPRGDKKQAGFYERLQYMGIKVTLKKLRIHNNCAIEKGVDAALMLDMLDLAHKNAYDTAILLSGDDDFVEIVERVKMLGKKVEIAAFEKVLGNELRKAADVFIPMDVIVKEIERSE